MSGGVKKTGSVSVFGVPYGVPSAAGQFNPQFQSVDFDRDAFTALLSDKGYDITWEKAQLCPNRPDGGLEPKSHPPNCTICDNGLGFLYFDAVDTKMLIQGVRLDQSYFGWGRWDAGQVMVTALPEYRINYWDRLTLGNSTVRFYELVRRIPGTLTDALKYSALAVNQLSWVNRSGALVKFTSGTDFVIDSNGNIAWTSTTGIPDDSSYYSIAYEYRPRYVVLDLVHQHRDSTVGGKHYDFPVQAVAKLDFLIRDESKDAPQVVDQNPFPR